MKSKNDRKPTGLNQLLVASILLATAHSALGQTTYFWDADADISTDTGGAGIWDLSSSLWRSGSSTGTLSAWPNSEPNADTAHFAGTADTLTLNSDSANIHLNRIVFAVTNYEIAGPASGTATLILSGTSPRITTGNAISATISAKIGGTTGLTKADAGTLTLSGNNSYTGVTTVATGSSAKGGIVNVSGDQSAANGGWSINGESIVNFQSDSVVVVGAGKTITLLNSASAGAHSLNVSGTVTSDTTGGLVIRGRSTINLESGADWTQSAPLTIQPLNTAYGAAMNVKTGANFTYDGTSDITLAKSTSGGSGGATLTLSGGTFTTSRRFSNSAAGSGSGATRINFSNGGTLKLSADIASLIIEGSTPFGVATTNAAGAVIDTNGFSTSIAVAISGVGGITETGTGTLTLSGNNSYAGKTTVSGGTLILAAENSNNDLSSVTIGDSGVLKLTFTGTDAVDKLFIGDTEQASGIYGHSSTGATNGGLGVGALDAKFAEGSGTLTVGGTPFQIFMGAYPGLTGNDALPEADPDGDDLSNIAEFIMGGTAPDLGSDANHPVESVISGSLTISMLTPSGTTFVGSPSPSTTVQGVQVAVGGSLDLASFDRPVEETALNPELPAAPSGYEWHTFRLADPISSQASGFLRASFHNP